MIELFREVYFLFDLPGRLLDRLF